MQALRTQLADGRSVSTDELVPLVYDDMRRLAGSFFQREGSGRTLQPTALVHEAFLRLADQDVDAWQNRAQFLSVAATTMRRVLVDAARSRGREKRGGHVARVTLLDDQPGGAPIEVDPLDLDAALEKLAEVKKRFERIVELGYFAGLTLPEVARVLGVARTVVVKEWSQARSWLAVYLEAR
ncbi:MAG: sigma-70 family RNA polymerase sigma factor [bacterium]|nr:sigma-70 family RNA polymerase sigma factor [bacterium]